MTMSHGFESQIAQAADNTLDAEARRVLDAHLADCSACQAMLSEQRDARAWLMSRPVAPVRDLSAAIRRTLENERPWIDRLNINWRVWSLRVTPVAAALALAAIMIVRSVDSSSATDTTAAPSVASDATASVASALWSDVSEDTLVTLMLRANPDDALSNYVTEPAAGAKTTGARTNKDQ